MNSEIKKQLEEMAATYFYATGWHHLPLQKDMAIDLYEAGAQAAWELATKPSADDEREAKQWLKEIYTRNFDQLTREEVEFIGEQGLFAGRRGLREAVRSAVEKERERIAGIIPDIDEPLEGGRTLRDEILNPKESGE